MLCNQLQIVASIAAYKRSKRLSATISVETVDKVDLWKVVVEPLRIAA